MSRVRKRKIRRTQRKAVPWSAIRKHNRNRKRSKIEVKVGEWLIEDSVPFVREKAIGKCHVDVFLAPRTIVELNGCYWHGCMMCNKTLSKYQKIAQIKDARRYAFFRNKGFDVIIFWEHDIIKEPDRVRAQLKALHNHINE